MIEYRCKFCHKLLDKLAEQKDFLGIEIKCPKCKKIQDIKIEIGAVVN